MLRKSVVEKDLRLNFDIAYRILSFTLIRSTNVLDFIHFDTPQSVNDGLW